MFILGVGSANGAPIPLENGDYLKDKTGTPVITHLNEPMCKQLASIGNGLYLHIDNTFSVEKRLNKELGVMHKGEFQNMTYSDYNDQFQAVAILIILLLIIDVIILEVKNPIISRWNIFHKKI